MTNTYPDHRIMKPLKRLKPLKQFPTALSAAAFLLIAALYLPASQAQTAPIGNPIIGTWSWTLFNGSCNETLQYRADGVLLSTSGDAVTEWRYAASSAADAQGFYKMLEISTRHNAKKDCSGDVVDEVGLDATKYIQLNPAKDLLIICKTPSLQACYGPLKRLP